MGTTNSYSSPSPQKRIKRKIKINSNFELTSKQKNFLDLSLLNKTNLIFCSGPAGTSKTYIAILACLELLNNRFVNDILYIRSATESSSSKLGYLPGEEAVKLEPYLRPLKDKLAEFLTPTEMSYLHQNGLIGAEHVGYTRGQDWKEKAIIIDEAQNLTEKEILTLVTRVGEKSKVFAIGDPMQSDIGSKSGFKNFMKLFQTKESEEKGIHCIEFTDQDIVRSELVKHIVDVYHNSKSSGLT